MSEKLETLSYGDKCDQLFKLTERLKKSSFDDLDLADSFQSFFYETNFANSSNTEIKKIILKIKNNFLNRKIIEFLKFDKSKDLILKFIEDGDLSYSKTLAKQLLDYCYERRLYSKALAFLNEHGDYIFKRNISNGFKSQFSLLEGDLSQLTLDLKEEMLTALLLRCYEKSFYHFTKEQFEKFIRNENLLDVVQKGSPRTLASLLFVVLTYMETNDVNDLTVDIKYVLSNIKTNKITIYKSHDEEDQKKLAETKKLIGKSKVLSNLKRKDLLEQVLFELRSIDENNAWLDYLNTNEELIAISDKERKRIFKSYDSLLEQHSEPLRTKTIEREILDLSKEANILTLSDLYFMSFTLGLFPQCMDIADKVIQISLTNAELINGMMLKAKTYMAMKRFLKANDYIDKLFDEIPVHLSEKKALLRMKIKCLEALSFEKEAASNKKILRQLET